MLLAGLLLTALVSGAPARADNGIHALFSVSPLPNSAGWVTGPASVTLACDSNAQNCNVEYSLDGASSVAYTTPFTISSDGTHYVNTTTHPNGDVGPTQDAFVVKIDQTAPTVTLTPSCSSAGSNGWCLGSVSLLVQAADATSGLTALTCAANGASTPCSTSCESNAGCPVTISSEGTTTFNASATDAAGNARNATVDIKIDANPPTVGASTTCASPGTRGWCLTSYTYSLTASDAGAGLATGSPTCTLDDASTPCAGAVSAEGAHILNITAQDAAGRTSTTSTSLGVDLLAPTISLSASSDGSPLSDGWYRSATRAILTASDGGSGVATVEHAIDDGRRWTSGSSFSVPQGAHTIYGRVTDAAGRMTNATPITIKVDTASNPSVLDDYSSIHRPYDDPGITQIVFPFSAPMDETSTLAAVTGATGWTASWGNDDVWLNFTRTDATPGATQTITIGSGAHGRHAGSLSTTGRSAVARAAVNYSLIDSTRAGGPTYNYVNISTTGTDTGIRCDDCGTGVPLPFPVDFYGVTYNTVYLSSNGFLSFDNSCISEYNPQPLWTNGNCARDLIAGYWEDLDLRPNTGDKVLYQTIGEAPHRTFIASWNIVHHYSFSDPTVTFEIKLFEGSPDIEVHYERADSDGGQHLVGLSNKTGARYLTYAWGDVGFDHRAVRFTTSPIGDTTPPTIDAHDDITAEATGASGAVITYTAPATHDDTDGTGSATCSPASTSTFALGSTSVSCSATDAAGNHATSTTFHVSVRDTTAPTIDAKSDVTAEATSATGATVSFAAPATHDAVDGTGTATCAPASGSTFAIGSTLVTCNAADAAGNHATATTFHVSVRDTTAPTIDAKSDIDANGTSAAGANVTYAAPATHDAVDGAGNATCAPASGSTFAVGSTLVTCNAVDAAGNHATATTFHIIVHDVTAPTITWSLSPASPDGLNGWYLTRPVLTASATDDQGVTAFENSSDGGATWTAFTSPYTYPEGTTTQILRAKDAAGNTATAAPGTIQVDLTLPGVALSGDNSTISGSNATVIFTFSEAMDRGSTESALTDASDWTKTWSADSTVLTLTRELPIGTSSLGITTSAMDAHGQHLSAPASVVLTRRAPPPTPPAIAPPDAPSGLTYTLDDSLRAVISWSPPVHANGDPVSGYRVYIDDAPYAETGSTHYATGPLARGAHHTFRVSAVNSAGESDAALIAFDLLPTSAIEAPAPDANGWYTTLPHVTLTADPADAEIHLDVGDGDVIYSGPFDVPAGDRTLTWYAKKGDLSETPHTQTFRVDGDAPVIDSASISSTFDITASASDVGSGIASVEGRLAPSDGAPALTVAMTRGDDGAFHGTFGAPTPGVYAASVIVRDAAGHETTAAAGAVTVAEPALEPEAPTPPTSGAPIETAGFHESGGSGGFPGAPANPAESTAPPTATEGGSGTTTSTPTPSPPPPPPPAITIHQPDGVGSSVDAGARGIITINVTGIDSPIGLSIVLIDSSGNETVLTRDDFNASFDTTSVSDGTYTIEVRRAATPVAQGQLSIQSTDEVLASLTFLVRNPPTAGVVAGAVATGVLVTGATQVGLSAAATSATSASASVGGSGFHATGFAQDVAVDAGQDTLRKKTKEAAALDRKRRIRSIEATIASLAVLASLWAFSAIQGWSFHDWLLALPIAGTAAALVMAMKYAAEGGLAWVTGAKPRIRLWIAGALSLAFSAIVFRNPFGYPGYVDETEESESPDTWRKQGIRALATIAGAAAFMLPFLALSYVLPWAFVSAGLLMASTNAATSAMPFGPLPGKDVWRWNKLLAVVVAVAGFGLYFAYAAAWIPMWALWTVGIAGGAWYAIAFYRFRKELRAERAHEAHAVRVPVQTPIPVRDADAESAATAKNAPERENP